MLKRPLCLAVCIYIAFLVGMRWVSEKDVPDLQAQNTVTILCQLDEIRGMGEKKNFVVSSVVADGKKVCNKLRVFPNDSLKWDQTMEIGNILELTGDLQPPEPAGNPGQFDEVSYYESQGISGKLYCRKLSVKDHKKYLIPQTLYKIRQSLCTQIESILPAQTAGVLWVMLLAEKSGLDDTVKELYTKGGIGHILAISGVKTLKLDIPLVPETRINWAFVPLHIAIIYILKLCLDEEIIPRCRFPCSRGYLTKCINWQKKQ